MHLKASILPAIPSSDTPTQRQINTDRWGWEPVSFSRGRTQKHSRRARRKVTLTTGSHLAPGSACLFLAAFTCAHHHHHPHLTHPSEECLAEGEGWGAQEPADSPINLNLHAWHISVP